MTSSEPKQIVILPQPDGDVVAHHIELGMVVGEFHQIPTGEIYFSYRTDSSRRWYVNKDIGTFRCAASIFNRCCELHAEDEDTDDDATWSMVSAKLRRDLEAIEPLDERDTSLWSATVRDTEGGLLSLC